MCGTEFEQACVHYTHNMMHISYKQNGIIDEMWLHIQTRDLVVFMIFFSGSWCFFVLDKQYSDDY